MRRTPLGQTHGRRTTRDLKHGFTLVEVLIAVFVIGTMTTLVYMGGKEVQKRANDAQRINDVNAIAALLEASYNEWGGYPRSSVLGFPDTPTYQGIPALRFGADIVTPPQNKEKCGPGTGAWLWWIDPPGSDPTTVVPRWLGVGDGGVCNTWIVGTNSLNHEQYRYEMLDATGNAPCAPAVFVTDKCQKFRLYYYLEGDNKVHWIESIH